MVYTIQVRGFDLYFIGDFFPFFGSENQSYMVWSLKAPKNGLKFEGSKKSVLHSCDRSKLVRKKCCKSYSKYCGGSNAWLIKLDFDFPYLW